MKNKNLVCITNVQWSCKTWRRNGFEVIHAKPNQLKTQRSLRKILRPEEHLSSNYTDNFMKMVKVWAELTWNHERSTAIMRDLHRTDPKHMELQIELHDE